MIKNPIQKKLLRSNMYLLIGIFIAVFTSITLLSLNQNKSNLEQIKEQIKNGLIAKGKTLISNNAQAMNGMVSDNSFIAVQNLVSLTVASDEDIVFGIYMSYEEQQAWVFANDSNPSGLIDGVFNFKDSISLLISEKNEAGYLDRMDENSDLFEFYAPVKYEDEILGFVRYGISKKNLNQALSIAKKSASMALLKLLAAIGLIAIACLLIAYLKAKKQAATFAKPIRQLMSVADSIANGDYNNQVLISTDDEVAELANSLDTMRLTIQNHTLHLEDLVDEKLKQVRNIFNNIDQGLFTVELDGAINGEYSKSSNLILGFKDISTHSVFDVLRFSAQQKQIWHDWMSIVISRYKNIRWSKLLKLAPVLKLEIQEENFIKTIQINYQPVINKNGEISSIMVLVDDITESLRLSKWSTMKNASTKMRLR